MYCSHCGSQTADNVAFCKNCGFRHDRGSEEDPQRIKRLALVAGGAIGAIGLVGFYSVLRELLHSPADPAMTVILLVAYLLTLLLMFTVLVRHAFKSGDSRQSTAQYNPPEQPQYFRPANTAQLPDTPASVTEHTTRTLDEVPFRER